MEMLQIWIVGTGWNTLHLKVCKLVGLIYTRVVMVTVKV